MNSRFHLSVTVGLALCLGAASTALLSPQDAIGYPATGAVSLGSNPVVSAGGTAQWGESASALFTAPADHDIVITDVVLSANSTRYRCKAQARVSLTSDSGVLGQFSVGTPFMQTSSWATAGGETNLVVGMTSGLRVPAGESVELLVDSLGGSYDCTTSDASHLAVHYAVGGYLAQP